MSELEPLLEHFRECSSPVEVLMRALEYPQQWRAGTAGGARLEQLLQSPLTKLCARYRYLSTNDVCLNLLVFETVATLSQGCSMAIVIVLY